MCAKIAVCLSGLVNKPCRLWIGWFLSRSSLPCRVLLILFFLQQLTARLYQGSKPSHQLLMWFSSQSHIPLLEYFPHSYKLKPPRLQPPWAILTWSTTPPTRRMAMRWKSKGLVSQPRWGFLRGNGMGRRGLSRPTRASLSAMRAVTILIPMNGRNPRYPTSRERHSWAPVILGISQRTAPVDANISGSGTVGHTEKSRTVG